MEDIVVSSWFDLLGFEFKVKSASGTVKAHKFAGVNIFESEWKACLTTTSWAFNISSLANLNREMDNVRQRKEAEMGKSKFSNRQSALTVDFVVLGGPTIGIDAILPSRDTHRRLERNTNLFGSYQDDWLE